MSRNLFSAKFVAGISALTLMLVSACSPSESGDTQDNSNLPALPVVDPAIAAEAISWADLMPVEEIEARQAITEGRADPGLVSQFLGNSPIENQAGTFNAVEDLDDLVVRMPGYLLPLDFAEFGSAREFLLLPFHGACVHYPPPPPNQIVYIRSSEPIEFGSLWEPVWVEGLMTIERVDTDLAATAYSMVVRTVEPYRP